MNGVSPSCTSNLPAGTFEPLCLSMGLGVASISQLSQRRSQVWGLLQLGKAKVMAEAKAKESECVGLGRTTQMGTVSRHHTTSSLSSNGRDTTIQVHLCRRSHHKMQQRMILICTSTTTRCRARPPAGTRLPTAGLPTTGLRTTRLPTAGLPATWAGVPGSANLMGTRWVHLWWAWCGAVPVQLAAAGSAAATAALARAATAATAAAVANANWSNTRATCPHEPERRK